MTDNQLEAQRRYRAKNIEKVRKWARDAHARNRPLYRKSSLKWYYDNKEKAKATHHRWIEAHKPPRKRPILTPAERIVRAKAMRSAYNERNRKHIAACAKAYRLKHIERYRQHEKERIRIHSPESRIKLRRRVNERYKTDLQFYLRTKLSRRVGMALRSAKARKVTSTTVLVGCSILELQSYLESMFQPGMTWQNRTLWHIDHIKPCIRFDLTDPEQQKRCFHYTNLQPLWRRDNLIKGAKWQEAA